LISILKHDTNTKGWSSDEFQPIEKVEALKKGVTVHLGAITIKIKNGNTYKVDYGTIDSFSSRH